MKSLGRVIRGFVLLSVSACRSEEFVADEAKAYSAVKQYWEWGNYWISGGLGFVYPGASYTTGLTFNALVFFSSARSAGLPIWGFCSETLRVCQSYYPHSDGSIQWNASTSFRKGESEQEAFNRFRHQFFVEQLTSSGPHLLLGLPKTSGKPVGDKRENIEPLQPSVRTVRRLMRLPSLGLPEATRLKKHNRFVEEYHKALPPGDCRLTIPFADDHSFVIPVLSECPDETSIMNWQRDGEEWKATPGGWMRFPKGTGDIIVDRIRAHPALVLQR